MSTTFSQTKWRCLPSSPPTFLSGTTPESWKRLPQVNGRRCQKPIFSARRKFSKVNSAPGSAGRATYPFQQSGVVCTSYTAGYQAIATQPATKRFFVVEATIIGEDICRFDPTSLRIAYRRTQWSVRSWVIHEVSLKSVVYRGTSLIRNSALPRTLPYDYA